ncbi:sigma-54 interaction domain-containing protein [Vibrio parahaemolyticus]
MKDGLAYIADMVRSRDASQVGEALLNALRSSLSLRLAQLLVFSVDGQSMVSHDGHDEVHWSVMDFSSPFAHVLQSGEKKLLRAEDVYYWQSNTAFHQITQNMGEQDGVCIFPLSRNGKIHALLFLIGSINELHYAFEDPTLLLVLDTFLSHWVNVTALSHQAQDVELLQERIGELHHQSDRSQRLSLMSTTLVGESEAMKALRSQVLNASESMMSVLIQGETGTGKELAARAVHHFSPRACQPFVAINCAAIPENLLESELFGYVKGAFSGAEQDRDGLIAQADGGSLFLDEIGDMPLALQAKLLRVLESGQYRPVGAKHERRSSFRLVCATHVRLQEQVHKKAFRQDLYYRLLQFPVTLPPLSSRLEDVDMLCRYFVEQYNQQNQSHVLGIEAQALTRLKAHTFPGNVRELKHLVEYGCVQAKDGRFVMEKDLLPLLDSPSVEKHREEPSLSAPKEKEPSHLKAAMVKFEVDFITRRLQQFQGDRTQTAESLGLPKRTLAYKCQKWGIQ